MKYIFLLSVFILTSLWVYSANALGWIEVINNTHLEWSTIPAGVWWIEVLNFDIVAGPKDIEIYSLYLKRRWLSDENTITWVSAFSQGIKITDNEDDNNWNNDEVELQIADEFIIPSWETRTVSIVANLESIENENISNNEFTFDLIIIRTPSWAQRVSSITGTTFRVGGVDIGQVQFIPDDPIDKISLSRQNRIFEFDLEAPQDSDVTLEWIRLRTTYDELDNDLEDIVLALDNKIISNAQIHDEYLTFEFAKPLFLEEWKRETFTIAARVKSRVDEELSFFLDGAEDLIYWDENQGTQTWFLQKVTPIVDETQDSELKNDEGDVITANTLSIVNSYIQKVEQAESDLTQRVKIFSDTIIALQEVATTKFQYRDTIAGIIYLLKQRISSY